MMMAHTLTTCVGKVLACVCVSCLRVYWCEVSQTIPFVLLSVCRHHAMLWLVILSRL